MKNSKLLRKLAHERARAHLYSFMRLMHPVVAPGISFIDARHLQAIAYHLELVARGEIKRLIIAVQPRHFKSFAASVCFPAWILGLRPYAKIICASYGTDLSDTFARQSRDILRDPRYRAIFPQTILDPNQAKIEALYTTAKGYRRATSVMGAVTGHGADYIIVDDPMKANDAYSEAARNNVYEWLKGTLMSRFDNPAEGRMVVVMQRLHQDDVIGRLISDGGWTVLDLPGEAIAKQETWIDDHVIWDRNPGDLLFPENFPIEALANLRLGMGESGYAAQVQQCPAPPGGALIKLKWFKRYSEWPLGGFERIFQSWDTAFVDSGTADYSVCTTWGVRGHDFYLLDVFRERLPYNELEKAVISLRAKHNAEHVIVEKAGTGTILMQRLYQLAGCQWLHSMTPSLGKIQRVESQLVRLEQGRVFLPETASWLKIFEEEIAAFPHGKYDDQVDSMTQLLYMFDYLTPHNPIFRGLSRFAGI